MSMKKRKVSDIQSVIMTVLSLMTVITSISMGLLLYNRYEMAMRQNEVRNTQNLMESTVNSMEQYLKNMRQISDTVTYNIIQAFDVSSPEFNQQLSFLYDFNKDKIQSIALYDMEGNLIVAEPVTLQKDGIEVLWQSWFENAAEEIENMHFSTPHMQNLFQDDAKSYHWVISLSRAVDGIDGDRPENGILLVDMKYSFIEEMMNQVNDQNRGRYYYVCDGEGNLIYHPYANEISNGLFEEDFSYMNIQKYRYKERFVTEYDVSEEIYPFCTVKLILQPILENAIYYGVGNMDEDDQPKIIVKGWKDDAEIYLSVTDNGMGMRHEDVENILKDNQKGPKHGSGVGLINVHTRIQLMFGNKYGLIVESEPDEGTTVTIHLPAVPYTKENCEVLETPGKPVRKEGES